MKAHSMRGRNEQYTLLKRNFLQWANRTLLQDHPAKSLCQLLADRCLMSPKVAKEILRDDRAISFPAIDQVAFALGYRVKLEFEKIPEKELERITLERLNQTQVAICKLVCQGYTDHIIAQKLRVGKPYVTRTLQKIMKQLEIPARHWLALWFYPGEPAPMTFDPKFIPILEKLINCENQEQTFMDAGYSQAFASNYLLKLRNQWDERSTPGMLARWIALEARRGRKWEVPKVHPRYKRSAKREAI